MFARCTTLLLSKNMFVCQFMSSTSACDPKLSKRRQSEVSARKTLRSRLSVDLSDSQSQRANIPLQVSKLETGKWCQILKTNIAGHCWAYLGAVTLNSCWVWRDFAVGTRVWRDFAPPSRGVSIPRSAFRAPCGSENGTWRGPRTASHLAGDDDDGEGWPSGRWRKTNKETT